MIDIRPIPAFNDNYIWIIIDQNNACVLDPGQKDPVLDYLNKHDLRLTSILITHHHHDHTGGVEALVQVTGAKVYGPMSSNIAGIDCCVQEGDCIDLSPIQLKLDVLEVPGHTLDHLAYTAYIGEQGLIFCGDTLFSCGAGRLFEGNSTQMIQSLDKFKKMSKNSLIYCAHEYTLSNIQWALAVEPHNLELQQWQIKARDLRRQQLPTIPTTLAQELLTNPFLRLDVESVQYAANEYAGCLLSSRAEVFSSLREWKNNF